MQLDGADVPVRARRGNAQGIKQIKSSWPSGPPRGTDTEHQTKKGASGLPFLFGYLCPAYFDFSSFNFAVRAGKTSL
jgi:hypothetical protein